MRQDIYVAFVNLRKTYDTVNRKALINKLYKKGITGKHAVIEQKPEINHLLLPAIISDLGLKQGDNLSAIELTFSLMTLMKYSMKLVIPYLSIPKGT